MKIIGKLDFKKSLGCVNCSGETCVVKDPHISILIFSQPKVGSWQVRNENNNNNNKEEIINVW